MKQYAYKVVPAPAKGLKGQGIKTPEARYANAVETLMNELAAEGWEYQRADTLPSTERAGLTGSTTEWRHLLVFRRALAEERADETASPDTPELLAPPVAVTPVEAPKEPAPEETVINETPEDVTEDTTTPDDADKGEAETDTGTDTDTDTDEDDAHKDEQKSPRQGATQMLSDNGVEGTSEVSGMTNSLQNLASNRNRLKGVTRGGN